MVIASDKGIPSRSWLSEASWNEAKKKLPIPCVDLIIEKQDGATLYGFRKIAPYKDVWALIGGRMLCGESLEDSASRIAGEYGIGISRLFLVGVFPVRFKTRSDVPVAIAAKSLGDEPRPDGVEFSRIAWLKRRPSKLGANYRRMLDKWQQLSASPETLSNIHLRK